MVQNEECLEAQAKAKGEGERPEVEEEFLGVEDLVQSEPYWLARSLPLYY